MCAGAGSRLRLSLAGSILFSAQSLSRCSLLVRHSVPCTDYGPGLRCTLALQSDRAGQGMTREGRAWQGEGSEWQRARQGMLCFIFRQKARSQEPRALAARCSMFAARTNLTNYSHCSGSKWMDTGWPADWTRQGGRRRCHETRE